MAHVLSVTNLRSGPVSIPGMPVIAAAGTRRMEIADVDLDGLMAGLDAAVTAGWIRYQLAPGARAVATHTSVGGAPSPDVPVWGSADILIANTANDSVTVTLPSAAAMPGKVLWLKRPSDANVLLLNPIATEELDDGGDGVGMTVPANAGQSVAVVSDGSDWWTTHNEIAP